MKLTLVYKGTAEEAEGLAEAVRQLIEERGLDAEISVSESDGTMGMGEATKAAVAQRLGEALS